MKFGKELREKALVRWRAYYVDYKMLKQVIKRCVNLKLGLPVEGAKGDQIAYFFYCVTCQLAAVRDFYTGRVEDYQSRLASLQEAMQLRAVRGLPFYLTDAELGMTARHLLDRFQQLKEYGFLNTQAFTKILHKFDKKLETELTGPVRQQIEQEPFVRNAIDLQPSIDCLTNVLEQLERPAVTPGSSSFTPDETGLQAGLIQLPALFTIIGEDRVSALPAAVQLLPEMHRDALLRQHLLPHACEEGADQCVRWCFEQLAQTGERQRVFVDMSGHSGLFLAVAGGHMSTVRVIHDLWGTETFLQLLSQPNVEDQYPLEVAVTSSIGAEFVRFVGTLGIDCGDSTERALRASVQASCDTTIVTSLLSLAPPERGLQVLACNQACEANNIVLLQALLAHLGVVPKSNEHVLGEGPLHTAARHNASACLALLLKQPGGLVELDAPSLHVKHTPLHLTCIQGHAACARLLVEAGAAVDVEDEHGWRPVTHAIYNGYTDFVEILGATPVTFSAGKEDSASVRPGTPDRDTVVAAKKLSSHFYLQGKTRVLFSIVDLELADPLKPALLTVPLSHCLLKVSCNFDEPLAVTHPLPLKRAQEYSFDVANPSGLRIACDIVSSFDSDRLYGRGLVTNLSWEHSRRQNDHYTCPLLGTSLEHLGFLTFTYLVITPLSHPKAVVDQRAYWITRGATSLIGHRGAGAHNAAYVADEAKRRTHVQENTLLSFTTAASLGAEYVEFDVQLTKDLVPVIYHNFIVDETGYHVPVSRMTLAEFQRVKISHSDEIRAKQLTRHRRSNSLHNVDQVNIAKSYFVRAPTTTLETILKQVPETLGFNIEIKYPLQHEREEFDLDPLEMNQYVDAILKCVYDFAGDRRIFFSTFHPDVARMVCLKQPTYPVFYLTTAGFASENVLDERCKSLRAAVETAEQANFLGVVSKSTPFVYAPELVARVKDAGLLLATYGLYNNDSGFVQLQKSLGIDAVIVDHVAHIYRHTNGV